MEASPKKISHSEFLQLTNISDINKYCIILDKLFHSPHKYTNVNSIIQTDMLGDPYLFAQYIEVQGEEDRHPSKKKGDFFGEFLTLPGRLEDYDALATMHLNNEIKIIFVGDFDNKDRKAGIQSFFRLVFYFKPKKGQVIDPKDFNGVGVQNANAKPQR